MRLILHFFFLGSFLLLSFSQANGKNGSDLYSQVKKYEGVKLSANALKRLSQYDHLIEYFSKISYFNKKHRLSSDFIKALMLAESNGKTGAVSSRDAIGLGQIRYTTGRQAAKELYLNYEPFEFVPEQTLKNLQRQDLFDPAVNILLTCYLISKYNEMFQGRLDLVVSAWNAGENTKSLSAGKHAPYTETENLIGKVNGYYLYLLRKDGKLDY